MTSDEILDALGRVYLEWNKLNDELGAGAKLAIADVAHELGLGKEFGPKMISLLDKQVAA